MKKLFVLSIGLVLASTTVKADPQWTPIGISDFFETATEAWIAPPDGDSGAPRQGWMSTADGFFTKEWHIGGSYQKANQGSDTYRSTFQFGVVTS